MKMIYNGTPMKSLNIKHFEMDTNDCTIKASDLQAGVTAYAKGKKVTGTGKAFEFAFYGKLATNFPNPIPNNINVVQISTLEYPLQSMVAITDVKNLDLTQDTLIANVTINGTSYPISVSVINNMITFMCDQRISLQIFYGKDNYI